MSVVEEMKATVNNWWLYLIQGVVFLIGAVYVFMSPAESYLALAIVFAVLMLFDAISSIGLSLTARKVMEGWGWHLAGGVLSLIIALALFRRPEITMTVLPLMVAFWIIFKGVVIIGSALDIRKIGLDGWGWILFVGVVNLVFGGLVLAMPGIGVALILIYTAIAFLVMGVGSIGIALRLRKVKKAAKEIKAAASDKIADIKASVDEYLQKDPDDIKGALRELKGKIDTL